VERTGRGGGPGRGIPWGLVTPDPIHDDPPPTVRLPIPNRRSPGSPGPWCRLVCSEEASLPVTCGPLFQLVWQRRYTRGAAPRRAPTRDAFGCAPFYPPPCNRNTGPHGGRPISSLAGRAFGKRKRVDGRVRSHDAIASRAASGPAGGRERGERSDDRHVIPWAGIEVFVAIISSALTKASRARRVRRLRLILDPTRACFRRTTFRPPETSRAPTAEADLPRRQMGGAFTCGW